MLIAGESAGGASICTLLAAPAAQGLYQAAAMESGSCRLVLDTDQAFGSFPAAYDVGGKVASELGCTGGDVPGCLRAAPVASVLGAAVPAGVDLGFHVGATLPVVDGVVLDQHPMAAIRGGRGAVRIIAGSNREDTSAFVVGDMHVSNTAGGFSAYLDQLPVTAEQKQVLLAMYPPGAITEIGAATALSTDIAFACPAQALAAVRPADSRLYELERPASSGVLVGYGAVHGLDFINLFGSFAAIGITPTAGDDAVHAWFDSAWGAAARGDAPEGWSPTGAGASAYVGIDAPPAEKTGWRGGRCAQLAGMGLILE